MIEQDELLRLIDTHESDQIELTVSTSDTDKFSEAVCAFANDLPGYKSSGYLIVGIKDDKTLSGLTVTDQLLQNLAALRSAGNIQPLPMIHIKKFSMPEGDVAVVEVHPSDIPPIRYKGKVWIRVGPRRAYATEQEERTLVERRTALAKSFDALPCQGAALNDLDLNLFFSYRAFAIAPDILEENGRELTLQLSSLRFFDLSKNCPTHVGMLLFGKNPLYWLPGAFIQFLRINGNSLADDVLSEKNISGDLLTILRELDALLNLQITHSIEQETILKEREVVDYPNIALREFLMNAVMHRSYEATAPIRFYWFNDRIEIQSPGGLYGEASEKNFPNQNAYRNPVIAETMKVLGYVNRYGSGVLRAQRASENNGNKIEFTFDSRVLVTLWKKL